jgi:hypothetical protein
VVQLDSAEVHGFTVAAHAKKTFTSFIAGPLHAKARTLKTVSVTLSQPAADGSAATSTASYPLVQKAAEGNGGPAPTGGSGGGHELANGKDGPNLAAGPPTHYQAVHDPRGDAHSSFQFPELFDLTLATAKRAGSAVVFSITSPQPLHLHDSYGNLVAPCIEIPFGAPQHYPMFLFGNGQLSGYTQHNWPKMAVHVSGTTISWTVPKKYLFKYGFLWRATSGCDPSHLADLAPNKGFKTFRWINVPKH